MQESQNIEWKEVWKDEYLKWVCGFANASGGKIIIGKNDEGEIIGLKDSKKLLEDLPNKIRDILGILVEIKLQDSKDEEFLEIIVEPYPFPVNYKGRYYFRSGSTLQELKGQALNEFLLKKSGKTWEGALEPQASFNEISLDAIEEFKIEATKSGRYPIIREESNLKNIFLNLRLYKDNAIKRSGLILFGKDPRNYIMNAYVKIGKFGNSDTELLYQDIVETNAFQLPDKTIEILEKKYFRKFISYEGINRIEKTEYPYEAVRESLLNAVIHKNYFGPPIQISIYDDKFMIWNPGELPDELSIEDLKHKHASYPRNPVIADVFFKAGLIETWGRGTLKIIEECKKVGLPEPKFEINSGGFLVTFYKEKFTDSYLKKLNLNDRQIKAVYYLKKSDFITNSIYQEVCGTSERTASRDLEQLTEKKVLKKIGEKKGTKYKLNHGG